MIAFTSDIDWAPEEAIYEMLEIFESRNCKCTLFCTHPSDAVKRSNTNLFEIGVHPNFNPLLFGNSTKKTAEEILQEVMDWYPEAIGIRNHALTQGTYLSRMFAEKGFKYESNTLIPYSNTLKPYKDWDGLWRIPFNWEDDVHALYKHDYNCHNLNLHNPEILNIFNFHPFHVFINTEKIARAKEAIKYNKNVGELKNYINVNVKGTKDLLIATLDDITRKGYQTYKLSEITAIYNV